MKKLLAVLVVIAAVVPVLALASTASACTQGLSPGWWKNQGANSWGGGYTHDMDFDTAFGLPAGTTGTLTLWQGLTTGGGGFNAFNRQAVAGLLNSVSGLDYEPTSWVIERVMHAYVYPWTIPNEVEYQKDKLEAYNQLGV
jgi:hypothetical protein